MSEVTRLYPSAWPCSCTTEDPRVVSSVTAKSHTFVEVGHEIISTAIRLLLLIQEGLLSVTTECMCTKNLSTT